MEHEQHQQSCRVIIPEQCRAVMCMTAQPNVEPAVSICTLGEREVHDAGLQTPERYLRASKLHLGAVHLSAQQLVQR